METLRTLGRKIDYLRDKIRCLAQEINKLDNGGDIAETDPVFVASQAFNITGENISDWDEAVNSSHTHANKSVLDTVSAGVVSNSHTHANKSALDSVTAGKITNWDGAATNSHTHTNKVALDTITSQNITDWNTVKNNAVDVPLTSTNLTNRKYVDGEYSVVSAATYTIGVIDSNKLVGFNNAAGTVITIPTNAESPILVNTSVKFLQRSEGAVTFVASSGATIRSKGDFLKISQTWGVVTIKKVATNEWILYGDLSA